MVLAFKRPEEQIVFPGFPVVMPDFSVTAIRDVFIDVASAIEADVRNARGNPSRLLALKERVQALEQEVQRWNDLIGYELNMQGMDS